MVIWQGLYQQTFYGRFYHNRRQENRGKDSPATFWVLLGEPVTSIAVPVWVEAKGTPLPLREGDTAPICAEALRIKRIIRLLLLNDSQR